MLKIVVLAIAILHIILVSVLHRTLDGKVYKPWSDHKKAMENIVGFSQMVGVKKEEGTKSESL
jgi:hypothetical protein